MADASWKRNSQQYFINMKRVSFIGGTSSYDYVKTKSYNQFFFDNLDLHDQVSERVGCESHLSVRNNH